MTSTRHESRGESVGSFPSIPRTPPRSTRSTGFRTKWHTLSSSARGLLCLHPPDDAYEDHWPLNNKVDLHKPARSKSQPSSRNTTVAPWNVRRGSSCHVHTMKEVAKHKGREAIWDDRMTKMTTTTTTTKVSPPESKPSPEAAASFNAPLIEQSGARRPGSENPLYDDHVATRLHLNGTQSRAEEAEPHIATGDTIEALMDAILQIGDYEECDSLAGLGTPSADTEAAIDDRSMVCGVGDGDDGESERTKKNRSAGAGALEEGGADARRAWEDMKRRVMDMEEFGATLPLDGARDAERASREFRARRRRSWAEKTIRGHPHTHTREEGHGSRRASTKKRRRHAGCWVREDGVFMRLYARRM